MPPTKSVNRNGATSRNSGRATVCVPLMRTFILSVAGKMSDSAGSTLLSRILVVFSSSVSPVNASYGPTNWRLASKRAPPAMRNHRTNGSSSMP